MQIIRLLIVESHEIIRLGLRTLIENQPLLHMVAETDCFDAALNLTAQHAPDVILLDLLLSDGNCTEHIPKLLDACPQSKILIFSSTNEEQEQLHVLRLGAAGIIAKHQSTGLLLKAIHAINTNQVWFDKNITKLLWQTHANYQLPETTHSDAAETQNYQLTVRECRIACLASKGWSAKKIGEQLFISEKTVRNQLTAVYEKLEVSGQVELCLKAPQLSFCKLPNQPCNRDKCPEKKE